MVAKVTVRCMLLPLTEDYLLLPNVCVAEVVGSSDTQLSQNVDGIHMGDFEWRGVRVPLILFENACALVNRKLDRKDRIAIIYHPDGDPTKPYIGLRLTDLPQTFIADSVAFKDLDISNKEKNLVESHFNKDDKSIIIPNLDGLFNLI